jgi:hypothetical protein
LQQTKGYLSTVISAVVSEDWSQVVQACQVDSWKEALAGVLTYTKNEEFHALCGKKNVSSLSPWFLRPAFIFVMVTMLMINCIANT